MARWTRRTVNRSRSTGNACRRAERSALLGLGPGAGGRLDLLVGYVAGVPRDPPAHPERAAQHAHPVAGEHVGDRRDPGGTVRERLVENGVRIWRPVEDGEVVALGGGGE